MVEKLNELVTIVILILLGALLGGCAGNFTTKDTVPVDSAITINQYQVVEGDVGVMHRWFSSNNHWTDEEQMRVESGYREIIRIITKLKRKTIAGQTDYHRLLYATEDMTDAWEYLKPELDKVIDIVKPATVLEDQLAISMWYRLRQDMDNLLQANNLRLREAKDGMDAATYDAFKADAKSMINTLTPLFKSGLAFL